MYSWRFESRTSGVRVTIRRNCLKSLNMLYTLYISGSSPIQIRRVGEFLIQSNPNPHGLDWIINPADWSSPFHTLGCGPIVHWAELAQTCCLGPLAIVGYSASVWFMPCMHLVHLFSFAFGQCSITIRRHIRQFVIEQNNSINSIRDWPMCKTDWTPVCQWSL